MLSLDELRELVGAAADVGETLAEFLRTAGLQRSRDERCLTDLLRGKRETSG